MTLRRIEDGWRQYTPSVALHWDDLIDWDRRKHGEGDFFLRLFRQRGCRRILDAACGTGFNSVRLLSEGFEVVSLDGSESMLKKAEANARDAGVALQAVRADWRDMARIFPPDSFDAIEFLGNSFTHLFDHRDRRHVMGGLFGLLKKGGVLAIDHRNYDQILDVGYSSKHKFVYCGRTFNVTPVKRSEGHVRMAYFGTKGRWFTDLYPIRKKEMLELMQEAGFSHVASYGDYQKRYGKYDADYIQHVAVKPRR
ncbi:MAG: class I SAM-dependent methyltransferase [Candidatus Micrarchaeota archaeon]